MCGCRYISKRTRWRITSTIRSAAGSRQCGRWGSSRGRSRLPIFRFRPRLIAPLLERFDILRLEGPKDAAFHDSLAPRRGNRTVKTRCFADKTGQGLSSARFAGRFQRLKDRGGAGVACGHHIGTEASKFPGIRCSAYDREGIQALARAHGFGVATMSELSRPAAEAARARGA